MRIQVAGVQYLGDAGLCDRTRVGMYGWSYGGYMSALALGKSKTSHGVELQAVCTGGTLSDLISQIGTTDISYICKYTSTPPPPPPPHSFNGPRGHYDTL